MSDSAKLRLLDSFKCLADACPDDCCHQWNAHVDKETLGKWQTIPDATKRQHLMSTVQESSQNPNELVLIRKENGNCIHLDEHGLCDIQNSFSHEYLPLNCQQFPRETITKNTLRFETAHLSCPAVIELLAKSDKTMLIENEDALYIHKSTDIISQLSSSIHHYMESIFKIESLYLGLKIYALSTVIAEIMQLAAENTLTSELLNNQYRQSPDQLKEKWLTWQSQSHNKEFERDKVEIKSFLQKLDTGLLAKYKQPLQDRFKIEIPNLSFSNFVKWREQADIDKYEPFFEKYIHVKFLNHGFPWNPIQSNHTATFLDCIFGLILAHHVVTAYHRSNIIVDEDMLKKITYTIEKINADNFDNFRLISAKSELLNISKYNLFFTLLV